MACDLEQWIYGPVTNPAVADVFQIHLALKRQISLYWFLVIFLICSPYSLEENWSAEQVHLEPAIGPHAGDHLAEEAVGPCVKVSSISWTKIY